MNPKFTDAQRTSRVWLYVIVLTHWPRLLYCTLNIFCSSGHLPLQVVPAVVQLLQPNLHTCVLKFRSQWGIAVSCSVLLLPTAWLLFLSSQLPEAQESSCLARKLCMVGWDHLTPWPGMARLGLAEHTQVRKMCHSQENCPVPGSAAWDHQHRRMCSSLQKKYSSFASLNSVSYSLLNIPLLQPEKMEP